MSVRPVLVRPSVAGVLVAVLATWASLLAPVAVAAEPVTGSISGRVSVPEGVDVTQVRVVARPAASSAGVEVARVGADGRYMLAALAAGTYSLSASHVHGAVVGATFPSGGLVLAAGAHLVDVDVTLTLAGALSGHVTVPADVDTAGLRVDVQGEGDAPDGWTGGFSVGADGTWRAAGLREGDYRVRLSHLEDQVWAQEFDGGRGVSVLAGEDRPGVDFEPSRSGRLSGRVHLSRLSEASRGCVRATTYTKGAQGWSPLKSVKVSEDGAYEVWGLRAGAHRIGFADSCIVLDDRVTAATQFYPDALEIDRAEDLLVSDGDTRTVPTFDLAPASHVGGYLYRYDRAKRYSLDGRLVQLFRQSGSGWEVVAEQRSRDGGFRFDSIPAGPYRLGFAKGDKNLREVFHPAALTLATARTFTAAVTPRYEAVSLGATDTWRRDAKVAITYEPNVHGKARVGRALRIDHASYAQHDVVTVRYQWQLRRGGKFRDIRGATAKRIALKPRHAGAQVRLRIIATAPGHQRHVHRTKWSAPVRR